MELARGHPSCGNDREPHHSRDATKFAVTICQPGNTEVTECKLNIKVMNWLIILRAASLKAKEKQ
jgi:hypothetical protein